MYPVSDAFLSALRSSHLLAARASITPASGGDPFDVPISSGTVTLDRTAQIRGTATINISDPSLYPSLPTSQVTPTGAEMTLYRGIRLAGGVVEYVPLGVYRVETAHLDTPGGDLVLTGSDRMSQVVDERFVSPRKFAEQQATTLIETLITEVYPAAVFDIKTADTTTLKKHVVEEDRAGEITRIAGVIGCEVFPDVTGTWVIQDIPDPTTLTPADSVWDIDAGPAGVLVGMGDETTRIGVPSVIIVTGETTSGDAAPVKSAYPHGYDTDVASPTYYLGPYGTVKMSYSSPLIRTQAQADKVADTLLAEHSGMIRTINFNAVPNPALTTGDMITVIRPGGARETHLLDTLTIPLAASDQMTSETRVVDWGGV